MTQPIDGPPKDVPNATPRDDKARAEAWDAGGSRSPGSLPDQVDSESERNRRVADLPVPSPADPGTPPGGGSPLPASGDDKKN